MLRKLAWGIGAGSLLAALVVGVWYVQVDQSALAQQPLLPRLPLTRPPAGQPATTPPPAVAPQPSVLQAPPQRREFVPLPDDVPRDADGLTAEERVNVMVYENCNRSVVNISTRGVREATIFMIDVPTEGAGSGSILDKQGNILTNYHVIENAREIEVTLFDGSTHEAELVGKDSATDIAVIRITTTPDKLFPVVYGDSARLKVGQRVFAIGNPFGLERTLTTGIVSSLNRQLPSRTGRTMKSIIQIDAAINPGNSGGPLLDSRGRLIGMNTAIASRTGQNTGVGFAVPVSNIARVVPQLLQQGRVVRPDIGIQIVFQTERGLLIAKLAPGGPAERAGLRGPKVVRERKRQGPFVTENELIDRAAADLIVGVDGQRLTTADEFLSAIESRNPGDETIITVVREGRLVDIPVRLGES